MKLRAYAAPWNAAIMFMFREGKAVGVNIVMEEISEFADPKPTFELDHLDAQTLMDDLWQAGLRPTEGTGSAGSLAATERHLEDMRTLVFNSPNPPTP